MENMITILTQAIAGGFAGYITNTYAINMLFKEYKIFRNIKIGGVIINTKDEFISNISKLVEKDIINHKTLGDELHKEEFSIGIQKLVEDFFCDSLKESLSNKNIEDIEGSIETFENIKILFRSMIEEYTREALEITLKQLQVTELISKEHSVFLLHQVVSLLEKNLNEMDFVKNFLEAYSKEYGDLSLEDIGGPLAIKIKKEIILESEKAIGDQHLQVREDINDFANRVFMAIDYEKVIEAFQDKLMGKKLSDVLQENQGNLREFLDSEESTKLLEEFSVELLRNLKELDKSILDLLSPEFHSLIETYLKENLPKLIEKLAIWIRKNSVEIEGLIQEAIDETIDGAEGMKGIFLSMIKETILAEAASKNNVTERILEFLEEKVDISHLSHSISEEIIFFLKNKKIKDIIIQLEMDQIIYPSRIRELASQGIINLIISLDLSSTNFINLDFVKFFNNNLKEKIVDKTEEYLRDSFMKTKVEEIFNVPLKEIIFLDRIPSVPVDLTSHTQSLIESMSKRYEEEFSQVSVNQLISQEVFQKTEEKTKEMIIDNGEVFFDKLRKEPILDYVNKINEIPNIHDKVRNWVLNFLHVNLPELLKGKIEGMVTENLQRLSPLEVNDMVHDFMGRELQPITRFGAFLGGGAGIILALTGSGTSLISLDVNMVSLLTYAFVGVMTNVIALEMIFRPYKKNKLLNALGLGTFSQGYILKNIELFGKNMGRFVEESLLERKMIRSRFKDLKMELGQDIKKRISSENYIIVEKVLENEGEKIATRLHDLGNHELMKKRSNLNDIFRTQVMDIPVKEIISDEFAENIYNRLVILAEKEKKQITRGLKRGLQSEKYLGDFVNEEAKEEIERYLFKEIDRKILNFAETIADKNFLESFVQKNKKYVEDFLEKPPSSWLDSHSTENISMAIQGKIEEMLFGLFVKENIPLILNKAEELANNMLKDNERKIGNEVKSSIFESLSFFQKGGYMLMGGDSIADEIIRKIVHEKFPAFLEKSKGELKEIIIDIQPNVKDMGTVKINLGQVVSGLTSTMLQVPLIKYLKILGIEKAEDVFDIFHEDIYILQSELSKELKKNKKDLSIAGQEIIIKIINILLSGIQVCHVTKTMEEEELEEGVLKIFSSLKEREELKEVIKNAIMTIYSKEFREDTLGSFLSEEIFRKDMDLVIEKMISSQETNTFVSKIISEKVKECKENRLSFIDIKTKKDLTDIGVEAGLDAIEKNLGDILSSLDFKKVTEEEIRKMDGREIHNLFKSFAGNYFTKLKLWGIAGAGFGIHGGLSIALAIGYVFSENKKRIR